MAPANIVLTLSMLTLAFIYMIMGTFLFSNTQINHMKANQMSKYMILKMIFGFLAGFSLSVLVVAQWQRILHLPVANVLLSTGLAFLTLSILMVIVVSFKYKRFLLVGLRMLISVALLLMPYLMIGLLFNAYSR